MRPSPLSLVCSLTVLVCSSAVAAEPTSTYTKIVLEKCSVERGETGEEGQDEVLAQGSTDQPAGGEEESQGGRWLCEGLPGYDLHVAEGDLRMMIGYGAGHEGQRVTTQTLSAFNSLAEKDGATTLEWRLRDGVPFATIVRYLTDSDASGTLQRGQVLVVAKLGPAGGTDACHVAYVDALANSNANELARQAADETAEGFDCARDPVIVGASGKSPF